MTDEQQVLIEKLKAYANGSLEWLPDLYEVVKDREKETTFYYHTQGPEPPLDSPDN